MALGYIGKPDEDQAKAVAEYNIEQLDRYASQGWPIVGCEPSCLMTFRDDYLDLVDDPRAKRVADHIFLIDEFLAQEHEAGRLRLSFREVNKTLKVHGHCQQKAIVGIEPTLTALKLVPGYEVTALNTGCCGMAGSFGYEKEHFDISMKIAEDRLFPAVSDDKSAAEFVAPGTSCRHQLAEGLGCRAKHPIEYIREAMQENGEW